MTTTRIDPEIVAANYSRSALIAATTFLTPEAVRTAPQHMTSAGDAFQRMVWSLDVTPLGSPLTRDDLLLIAKSHEHDANTSYLNRLAAM